MTLDFATLDTLRTHHPAWRLLRSDHATLVASFLYRVRLEQEHIGFHWLGSRLQQLLSGDTGVNSGILL